MVQYDKFLAALDQPFSEFVQDAGVNEYLSRMGQPVVEELSEKGVKRRFTVISGYREGQGVWGTWQNGMLRFGDKTYRADGLERSQVLTPKIVGGKNPKGEEVEYRFGISMGQQSVVVVPVILRKTPDVILLQEGRYVANANAFCVDRELVKELGKERAEAFTLKNYFLTQVWQFDDYFRKLNPEFQSDYGGAVWSDTEFVAGRNTDNFIGYIVVLGLNYLLFSLKEDPDWLITELKAQYLADLKARLEVTVNQQRNGNTGYPIGLARDLFLYIEHEGNYQLLDPILAKKVNLIPFLANMFGFGEFIFRRNPLEICRKIIEATPEFIDQVFIDRVWALFFSNSKDVRRTGLDVYKLIWEKRRDLVAIRPEFLPDFVEEGMMAAIRKVPARISQKLVDILLELCAMDNAEYRLDFLETFKIAMELAPQYINAAGVARVIEVFADSNPEVAWIAKDIYKYMVEKAPSQVANTVSTIMNRISRGSYQARELALFAYKAILERSPQTTTQTGIDLILDLVSDENDQLAWVAFDAYRAAIQHTPQYVNSRGYAKIIASLTNASWIWRRAGLQALGLAIEHRPDLVDQKDIQQINAMFNDENKYVKETATRLYQLIPKNLPTFTHENIIDQIFENFKEKNDQIKKNALKSYESALINTPHLISPEKFEKILRLLAAPEKETSRLAINAFKITLENKAQLITEPGVIELFSHLSEFAFEVMEIYKEMLEITPQFIPLVFAKGVESLSEKNNWLRQKGLEIYALSIQKRPDLITKANLTQIIERLIDRDSYVHREALRTLETVIKALPSLKPQILEDTLQILLGVTSKNPGSIINQLQYFFKEAPELIPPNLPKILELLASSDKNGREVGLNVVKEVCEALPDLITQEVVDRIVELFIDPEEAVKITALSSYRSIIGKLPQYVRQEVLFKFIPLFAEFSKRRDNAGYIMRFGGKARDFSYGYVAAASRETYLTVLEKIPKLIPATLPEMFEINLTPLDGVETKIMMLKVYKFALMSATETVNGIAAMQILIACFSGTRSWGFNYNRKQEDELYDRALEAFQLTLNRQPTFINRYVIQVLMNMFCSPDPDVQSAILKAIGLLFQKPEFISEIMESLVIGYFHIKDPQGNSPAFKLFVQIRDKIIEVILQQGKDPVFRFLKLEKRFKYNAVKLYYAIFEKNPAAITPQVVAKIAELLFDPSEMVQWAALKFFMLLFGQHSKLAEPHQERFNTAKAKFKPHIGLLDLGHDFLDQETLQSQIQEKAARESKMKRDNFNRALEKNLLNVIEEMSDDTEDQFKYLALSAFEKAIEENPKQVSEKALINFIKIFIPLKNVHLGLTLHKIFQYNPQLITPEFVQTLLKFISHDSDHTRLEALRNYHTTFLYNSTALTREGINKLLERDSDGSDYVREEAFQILGGAIQSAPQFIDKSIIEFIKTKMKDSRAEVASAAIAVFAKVITKRPQYVDKNSIQQIFQLFSSNDDKIKISALETYVVIVVKMPECVTKEAVAKILSMILCKHDGKICYISFKAREQALKTYKQMITNLPEFITQEGIEVLLSCFTDDWNRAYPDFRKNALDAYIEAFGHTPQYISEKGFEQLQKALNSDPVMKGLWNNLGINYCYRKEYTKAIEIYKKALEIIPENADLLNGLAWTYYLMGTYEKSVPLAEKAVKLSPYAAHMWDTLACGYYGLKQYQKAWESFQRMKKINSNFKGTEEIYLKVKELIEKETV